MKSKGENVIYASKSDEWETPKDLFKKIEKTFGPFDLDPAATAETAKAHRFFTKDQSGLVQTWKGKVYLNPPYSEIGKWMDKARSSVL